MQDLSTLKIQNIADPWDNAREKWNLIDGATVSDDRTLEADVVIIGTGAGDPQKMDPAASRETLDHSIMYIFAVALQDGEWHHEKSYAPARVARPDTVARPWPPATRAPR